MLDNPARLALSSSDFVFEPEDIEVEFVALDSSS
jgi:hypothetical protein